ncbi:mitochondrial pyruvate carrier [Podospora australis]|uniref:Mitochondrial pyruvate carrier n=1 Tax=Podospora australis TaxID=1536484 RepID=A0AAN6WMQ5_9PEZI|nr:mitochondrial pyruvate carrier [Podospora australis]
MAALIKAANAKIRSNPVTDYLCSTHFWGPVSNYSIPLAAVLDTRKSPELISPKMTGALTVYAFTFMRFSLAITPKNYLLFACHTVNACAQTTQGYRYLDYHYWGGKESGKYASLVVKDVKAPEGKKK